MPKNKKVVEAALSGKGFREPGGDHNYYVYCTQSGKKTSVKTKTSHGSSKDIDDSLLGMMARQCHLTSGEFKLLIECSFTREMYEGHL